MGKVGTSEGSCGINQVGKDLVRLLPSKGKGGSWKICVAEDAAHGSQGKQSQLGALYLPAVQKCSIIDGQRSAQGGNVTKYCLW